MPPLFEADEKTEVWGIFKENGGMDFGIKERANGVFDAFCACAD